MRFIHTAATLVALAGMLWSGITIAGNLGTPVLSPASIQAGKPVTVRITAAINDVNYIAGGANVQRLNADGSVQSVIGLLHDDGSQGDAAAGDQVYTLDVLLNEASVGSVALQVSAAYKRELKRTVSAPLYLTVTPPAVAPAIKTAGFSVPSAPAGMAMIGVASASIDSATAPSSVVLQKVDANNVVLANLGALHDDGADGDAAASDRIYSLRTTVLENAPGTVRYRIAATFPGSGEATFSDIFTVAITGTATGIEITSPSSGAYLNTPVLTVSGKVGDPAAQVTLNGIAAVLSGTAFNASVPLNEGPNTITAVATNSGGSTTTNSVLVTLDTTAPKVEIYSPAANSSTSAANVTVSGMVNDIVVGTVNAQQASVTVNGIIAEVLNRSFVARDVPLNVGANTVQAIATDRAGNRATISATVTRLAAAGGLKLMSGNNQRGPVTGQLAEPLVVALTNGQGTPIANRPVVFRVIGLDGTVAANSAAGSGLAALAVNTDSDGKARAYYRLGSRAGAGNLVEASAAGAANAVDFVATGTSGGAGLMVVDSGNNQTGVIGQPLPWPFIAIVTDANNNRLGGIPVTFTVKEGGGGFGTAHLSTVTATSDSDGRVAVTLVLGPEPGIHNNVVEANFAGGTGFPAAFTASGLAPGPAAQTRISGVVLDNSNHPIPGVTMRLLQITQGNRSNIPQEMAAAVQTDAQGQFIMQPVPVGIFKLMADGGTAARAGTWPTLDFDMATVPGQNNTLGMPIFLPALNPDNRICVDETSGGTLTLPDVPGFALTIAPGSATFAGGSRSGCVSVTPVNMDKVPMAPGFGQQPRFVVTIQPVGTHFNPPARMTIPNVDGLAPRAVTEMYSYDHDLASFVAIGSATVSEDGATITSDVGAGVIKAGWHCGGNPNPSGSAGTCPSCQKCEGSGCVNDSDQDDKECSGTAGKCSVCKAGSCTPEQVKLTVVRDSLTQTTSTGIPKPGATPAFGYSAKALSGSNTPTFSSADLDSNPNMGNISSPGNPNASPTPGGLAELKVTYQCKGGDKTEKKFKAATFGLSCYKLADESDNLDANGKCTSIRIGGVTYSGETTNPTGLPSGIYCTAFLADVRLQGSGSSRNGTKVHYVSGSNPNWIFEVVSEFLGADNRPLIRFGSCARDRAIVPRSTMVNLEGYNLEANDTGGAIIGYRLDVFGGTGNSACAGFINKIVLGACSPGTSTCPAMEIPE